MAKIIIIGGGASGMMAGVIASQNGNDVTIIEKNEKLGKKIYITGKGRCNLTNHCSKEEFFGNIVSNPKFMYCPFNYFSNDDTYNFFESNGLKLKVERGNRVFPLSDKASDVTKTLQYMLEKNKVKILLNTNVLEVVAENGIFKKVKTNNGEIYGDSVIIATGGISYPLTGSTGDGYKFAKSLGHSIISPKPALVGIEIKDTFYLDCQGISLKNVSFTVKRGDRVIFNEFGEMLITHFGISGPIVLTCSSKINREDFNNLTFSIDFKPALSNETLDRRLIKEFEENNLKDISTVMKSLLPSNFIKPVLEKSQIKMTKKCSEITIEERERLRNTLKYFSFKAKGLRPIDEAIITSGGVCIKEIDPRTMESKLVKNVYFAGEVIDVDCLTGGFNLQTAFSTGFVAGSQKI